MEGDSQWGWSSVILVTTAKRSVSYHLGNCDAYQGDIHRLSQRSRCYGHCRSMGVSSNIQSLCDGPPLAFCMGIIHVAFLCPRAHHGGACVARVTGQTHDTAAILRSGRDTACDSDTADIHHPLSDKHGFFGLVCPDTNDGIPCAVPHIKGSQRTHGPLVKSH